MSWTRMTLGQVVEIYDHIRIPLNAAQRSVRKGPYPYYGAQGIIDSVDDYLFDGRYLLVPEDGENLNSRKLPIAFFATGRFWVNNHAHILRGRTGIVDDEFLKHLLTVADISGYITGAAQPKLSQENLKRIELRIPPLDIQRQIADILSAYDDLIEVNTRRIAVLEEMARRLFDACFGKPRNNWPHVSLGSMLRLEKGISYTGKGLKADGLPMINLKNVLCEGGFRRDAVKRYSGDFKSRHTVRPGDIVVANTDLTQDRAILASPAFVPKIKSEAILFTHHLYVVRLEESEFSRFPNFIYGILQSSDYKAFARGHATGTTVLGLPREAILNYGLARPPLEELDHFEKIASPLRNLIDTLEGTNDLLVGTRDLLLPKLISGEIDVSDAEGHAKRAVKRAAAE